MAKSDFDIDDNNEYENEVVNNKKNFLNNRFMNNINNPDIVYDENTDTSVLGRITYFFSTINRSVLAFFGIVILAIIVGIIVVTSLISAYNKSFKTEIKIPDVVYLGETAAISAISSGTGNVANTTVTFENKVYEDPDADEDIPNQELALELANDKMKGKTIYNTMIPIEEGSVQITVKASSGAHKMGKAEKVVYVCPRFSSNLVSNSSISVKQGDTIDDIIDFGPGACSKNITYKSSNTDIFTVDKEGKIEGIKQGTANLIVKRNERSFSIPVYVTSNTVTVNSFGVSPKKIQIKPGENRRLNVSYLPLNANTQKVTYTTGDSEIVSVDKYGKLIGQKEGVTNITAKHIDVDDPQIVEVVVSKLNSKNGSIVTDLVLEKENLNLIQGESSKINYYVLPNESKNKGVTFKSSDESIAVVNKKGVVFAKKSGETLITVSTNNSITKTVNVKVDSIDTPIILADDGIIEKNWHNSNYKIKFSGGGYGVTYYYGNEKDKLTKSGTEIEFKKNGQQTIYSKACLYNICGPVETTLSKLDTEKPKVIKVVTRADKNSGYKTIYVAAEDNISMISKWCVTENYNSRKCNWMNTTKIKNPVLSRRINNYGEYYIFVKDVAGNISDPKVVKVDSNINVTGTTNSPLDDY